MRLLIFFLVATSISFLSADPLLVHLDNDEELVPIYVSKMECHDGSVNNIDELSQEIQFDLAQNGTTEVVAYAPDLEVLCSDSFFGRQDSNRTWKALNIPFVVKGKVENQKLTLQIYDLGTETIHKAQEIALTGDPSKDRTVIHQFSDTFLERFFGKQGIATTKVLYTIKTSLGEDQERAELWEADYDGKNLRQVTNENTLIVTPTYVPNPEGKPSRNALYVSYKIGIPKIHTIALEGKASPQRVTSLRGNQLMPMVSPQRDQLALISDAGGNPDLFIQPFPPKEGTAGAPRQIYAIPYAAQASPTFSPDGKRLAFVSNKDGRPRIYVMMIPRPGMRLNQISVELITKRNAESTSPAWSSDGKKLVYSSRVDGVRQIFVYEFETRQETQLTSGHENKENPTWAPNNQHVMYNTSVNETGQLYLLDTLHPNPIRITQGPGHKRFPAWQPR